MKQLTLRVIFYGSLLFFVLSPGILSQQYTSNQDTFKISSSEQRYNYTLNNENNNNNNSVVKLTLTNSFASEDRSVFLCFFTSINAYDYFTDDIFTSANDMEGCFLQEATQIIFINYPSTSNQLFVYSVFLDSAMKVTTYSYEVETFVLVELIQNAEACSASCNIKCQKTDTGEQPQAELTNEQKQISNCPVCQETYAGATCSHDIAILKANDFELKTHLVELKPRQWNFFGYLITNEIIDKLKNNISFEEKEKDDEINYIFYLKMQTQRQKGSELDIYLAYTSEKEDKSTREYSLPDFRSANKIGPAFLFEERIVIYKSFNENSFKPQLLIIGVFNADKTTKETQMYLMNTQLHSEMEPEMQEISLTDAIILLGIVLCILLILGMYCLGVALHRKSYREERRSNDSPNNQIISVQQIEKYMGKYPYVHILKAVSKRKSKIMGDLTSETHKEGARRISVKCGSILGKNECAICLTAFELTDICRLTICDHVFHAACIDSWLSKNNNCPFCRFEMNQETLKNWIQNKQISGYYPLDEELDSIPTEEVLKQEKSQEKRDIQLLQSNGIAINEQQHKDQNNQKKNEYFKFSEESSFQSDGLPSGKEINHKEGRNLQKISSQSGQKQHKADQGQNDQENLKKNQQQISKDNSNKCNGYEIALQLKGLTSNDNEGIILNLQKQSENSTFQGVTPINSYQENAEVFSALVENQEIMNSGRDDAKRQGNITKNQQNKDLNEKKNLMGLHKKYESKEALLKIPLEFIDEVENNIINCNNQKQHDDNIKNDPQMMNLLNQDVVISMATNESPVKTNLQSNHTFTGFQLNQI